MDKINILGVEINKINYQETLKKIENFIKDSHQHYIVTSNPEIILKATQDIYYRAILNNADLCLPDGFGLILGSWLLGNPIYHRVTGIDLSYKISELANKKQYKIFLLGGQNNASKITKIKLELKYRNIKIVGAEDGFSNIKKITSQENQNIIEKIKNSDAQILFVAYGAPFQEKWIYQNLKKIPNIKIALGLGGTFDFISGKIIRAPKIVRKLGLEWLWRWFLEPYRASRIFNATIGYIWALILWTIHIKQKFRQNVLAVILNKNNEFLIVNRRDNLKHWQFPQGGVEKGENDEDAVLREIKEETNLTKLKILGKLNEINRYYFMPQLLTKNKKAKKYPYCGQEQKIIILKQTEDEKPLPQEEHKDYQWIKKEDLLNKIHPIRHQSLKLILKHINEYI